MPEEQKGCRRGNRGTKDQQDKTMFKYCKEKRTNLSRIDYKKVYDIFPHS